MSKEVQDGKACAVLSYLLVGIIWYFVDEKMKKNTFVKYHVKQGLVLLILCIALQLIFSVLWIFWVVHQLISVLLLILAIIGIIAAANGEKKELPVIGQFAKHFTF